MTGYENSRGTVDFSRPVFAMIAFETAIDQDGIYAVTNTRGRPMWPRMKGNDSLSYVDVSMNENKSAINIKIYVVMRFGTSISRTAHRYSMAARKRIREVTGVEVDELVVAVTGVKSRKITPAELEISC